MNTKFKRGMEFFHLDRKYMKMYLILFSLFLLYVFPIILADRYYNDDLARSLYGATGWDGDGRPLTEGLMRWLCNGLPISDISPFALILGVALLAYFLVLYLRNILPDQEISLPVIYMLFLFLANPFLLSNLSYKFDSFAMLFSLCVTLLCFSIPESLPRGIQFWMYTLLCLIILSTYQATIGAYIGLILISFFLKLYSSKPDIRLEILRICSLGISGVFYKLVIAAHFVAKDGWRKEAAQFIPDLSKQSLIIVYNNLLNLGLLIDSYIKGMPLTIKILVALLFFYFICYAVKRVWTKTDKLFVNLFKTFYIILMPLGLILSSIAPLIFLNTLGVKSRILISFSTFTFYIGLMLLLSFKKNKVLVVLVIIPCMFFNFTYAYAYGNTLKGQKNYEAYIGENIARDVEKLNAEGEYSKITIDGNMPRAKQVQLMCEKYPQFYEIVPVYINNDPWIGGAWLYYYLQENLPYEEMREEDLAVINNEEPVETNAVYSCYINDDKIIIHFR